MSRQVRASSLFMGTVKQRGDAASLAKLSIPIVLATIGGTLPTMVGLSVAGRLGTQELAATGFSSVLFMFVLRVGAGLAVGVAALSAQAFGASQPRQANQYLWQGVYITLAAAVPLMLIYTLVGWNASRLGLDPKLLPHVRSFVLPRALTGTLCLLVSLLGLYLETAKRMRALLVNHLVANVAHVTLALLLAMGDRALAMVHLPPIGMQGMGIAGIAWSSAIVWGGQLLHLASQVGALPDSGARSFAPLLVRRVLLVGGPVATGNLTAIGGFMVIELMVASLGIIALSAHQVVSNILTSTKVMAFGVSRATTIHVGRAAGRGDSDAVQRATWIVPMVAALFVALPALGMFLLSAKVVRIYTSNDATIMTAAALMPIAAGILMFDALQLTAAAALRSLGSTRFVFVTDLLLTYAVAIPLVLLVSKVLSWGVISVWCVLVVMPVVQAFSYIRRFRAEASGGPWLARSVAVRKIADTLFSESEVDQLLSRFEVAKPSPAARTQVRRASSPVTIILPFATVLAVLGLLSFFSWHGKKHALERMNDIAFDSRFRVVVVGRALPLATVAEHLLSQPAQVGMLLLANPQLHSAADVLPPGTTLRVPVAVEYVTQPGDDLASLAQRFRGRSADQRIIYDANRAQLGAPKDLRPGLVLSVPLLVQDLERAIAWVEHQ